MNNLDQSLDMSSKFPSLNLTFVDCNTRSIRSITPFCWCSLSYVLHTSRERLVNVNATFPPLCSNNRHIE